MASERRPEGVEGYTLDSGLFPFDAFTSTQPTVDPPVIHTVAPWVLLGGNVYYEPTTLNVVASDGETGTVAGVTTMFDGQTLQVEELAATPGWDFNFDFSGIEYTLRGIVVRADYEGSATHGVGIEMWRYTGTPGYDRFTSFVGSLGYTVWYVPIPANIAANYVSGGAAKVRLNHFSAGNASHYIVVDYVGLVA